MQFKGVFFDLYGTLLVMDDERAAWEDWFESLHESLAGMGLLLSRDEMRNRVDGVFSMCVPPLADDGLTLYERRMGLLTRDLGLDLSEEGVSKAASACLNSWHAHTSLDEEVVPLLLTLEADRRLALISNFEEPPHIHRVLEELDLARFFPTVVVSGDTGTKKPDPAIFAPALESTGLPPEATVYVGDSDVDVEGARAAGIRPILIRRGASTGPIGDFRADGNHAEGRLNSTCLEGVTVISTLAELPYVLRG